jgi:hypothetical protein
MIKHGKGGGNTTTGKKFEAEFDLAKWLKPEYETVAFPLRYTRGNKTFARNCFGEKIVDRFNNEIGLIFTNHGLNQYLAGQYGIAWKSRMSRELCPDAALFIIRRKTVFIIEMKTQGVSGSTDEKLQTCHFKKRQFEKLLRGICNKVEYIYYLANWFRDEKYSDVLEYIKEKDVGCRYFFEQERTELKKLIFAKNI